MSDVVNGYLEAMQAINDRPDHGYTFEFLKMKGARNAIDASKQHFGALCNGTLNEIDINGFIGILERWFYEKDNTSKDYRVEKFCELLTHHLGNDVIYYHVGTVLNGYYNDADCITFQVKKPHGMIYYGLELGVND
ncbi:hypothetical protein [Paenibacillus tianmuensis]|nr:hypothetical protein [Paenibacillus tianmuensis]